MANRPVYVPMNQAPYYKAIDIEFVYNRGLNIKQKQKNIVAIHEIFMQRYPKDSGRKYLSRRKTSRSVAADSGI